ncbi:DNA repair protein RecN [Gallionella capsiferriformans]|uniref:DNA repair protein RecN n=1 Tax=Gallionella capsiferriformans (strain ES-2) TaxID=395494 RepID=D9SIJ6_GALCS|nr:DNA repair protein RecN [Gallionella capsiferriformans]ADL56159.1 DNA repair protein RecN [Gallionella capsiferriformans ES-2]
MLKFLSIRDFVIVSQLELAFCAGFTALTGETGAGKSILIDALLLALGERGDATMVRNGCERAEITAEFDVSAQPGLLAWLKAQELEGDDGVCLMRRLLDAGGRSRGFINGRSATLQQMREAGEHLLNIHGQHAHQSLLQADAQRVLLDEYAGLQSSVAGVATDFRDWQALMRRRIALSENSQAVAAERELLTFQHTELEALAFNVADWEVLQADYARMAHAASLLETAAFGIDTLSEAETACLSQLNALMTRLRDGTLHDATLAEPLRMLESAQAELQEVVYSLRHYQQRLDADPQQMAQKEARIQYVMDLARKYRVAPERLGEVLQQVARRLAELGADADLEALQQLERDAHSRYLEAARALSRARRLAADKLSQQITAAMQTLAMQGGSFAVALLPLTEGNVHGLEAVEFQVAANPGVPTRSLAKVASGGELSRISLAMQVATSQVASVPTLIFDEVDSGIGGRVAEIVGLLLKQLGRQYQVLCVTHLPQVAAMADSQWQVSKAVEAGVTLSRIEVLGESQRIEEIARMLGGVTITDTTRRHAAEMLGVAG